VEFEVSNINNSWHYSYFVPCCNYKLRIW
jgi:hypothetical protein